MADGCPVLRVHLSFGKARHMGQRTDKICLWVRVSGATPILFNIAELRDGQSCAQKSRSTPKWEPSWRRSVCAKDFADLAFHGGNISRIDPCFFSFKKTSEDFP